MRNILLFLMWSYKSCVNINVNLFKEVTYAPYGVFWGHVPHRSSVHMSHLLFGPRQNTCAESSSFNCSPFLCKISLLEAASLLPFFCNLDCILFFSWGHWGTVLVKWPLSSAVIQFVVDVAKYSISLNLLVIWDLADYSHSGPKAEWFIKG